MREKFSFKDDSSDAVEVVVIADRSGSMASIRSGAIEGFNSFLTQQKALPGKANFTLILFDDEYKVVHDRVPINDVPMLDNATFVPRGWTALNDAIGKAVTKLNVLNPKKAVIAILTDGEENASKEFTTEQIKNLIRGCENERKWQVAYLAANQDAFKVGATYGFQKQNTYSFNATVAGTRAAFGQSMNMSVSNYRNDVPNVMNDDDHLDVPKNYGGTD